MLVANKGWWARYHANANLSDPSISDCKLKTYQRGDCKTPGGGNRKIPDEDWVSRALGLGNGPLANDWLPHDRDSGGYTFSKAVEIIIYYKKTLVLYCHFTI